MQSLKEVWLSFLGAVIRFWDNRFTQPSCQACQMLKTEVSRLSEQNSSLVDRLLGQAHQPAETGEAADSKLETIHRAKKSWSQIRQELESSHRRQPVAASKVTAGNDLASFEQAIKELETADVGN